MPKYPATCPEFAEIITTACCKLHLLDCTIRSSSGEDSSGEFPVGMSRDEGGVVWGIVRLDPNPSALAAARPQDKLTCRLWASANASRTLT